jgi:hypothetical protein
MTDEFVRLIIDTPTYTKHKHTHTHKYTQTTHSPTYRSLAMDNTSRCAITPFPSTNNVTSEKSSRSTYCLKSLHTNCKHDGAFTSGSGTGSVSNTYISPKYLLPWLPPKMTKRRSSMVALWPARGPGPSPMMETDSVTCSSLGLACWLPEGPRCCVCVCVCLGERGCVWVGGWVCL